MIALTPLSVALSVMFFLALLGLAGLIAVNGDD